MNPSAMIKPFFAIALAACSLAALSACGSEPGSPPPLEGAALGGPFELTSGTGKTVKWDDFAGKYRIVYFGYAYCPDVCPFDVQRMMQGFSKFAEAEPKLAEAVQPIFITIDPERDTPEKIQEFTSAFSDRLLGLTGTPEQIAAAAKSFAVYYAKGEVTDTGAYLMDHSRAAYLMDRDGKPLALLPVDAGAEQVTAELLKWVH